jgi:putative nucleotidyltransferase with HDIG domain
LSHEFDRTPGTRDPIAAGDRDALGRAMQEALTSRDLPIPPYPSIALRIQRAAAQAEVGLAEVAELIGSDAALAADVLRCANSSVYMRGERVSTLTQAVTRVGARQIVRLVLASGLATDVQVSGPLSPLRRSAWLEGLSSAAICEALAPERKLDPEQAFLAGLLHDFGKVVAVSTLEIMHGQRRLDPRWSLDDLAFEVELQHLHFGALVAQRWRLPELVCQAIAEHHGHPGEAGQGGLIDLVRASDEVVGLLTRRPFVSAASLVRVRTLQGSRERELVGRLLAKLPEMISSLEKPERKITPSPFAVARGRTTLSVARPARFGVTLRLGFDVRQYVATEIAAEGVALEGPEPLQEGGLVEATLQGPPEPLRVWALGKISAPSPNQQGRFRVEIQPFALTNNEQVFWDHLVRAS